MNRFAASVQYITGQELEVKAVDSGDIVKQEIEDLRSRVEELSNEVRSFPLSSCLINFRSKGNYVMISTRRSPRSTL